MNNHYTSWKTHEVDYLKNCYHTMTIETIANELGRTVQSIRLKAYRLGLVNMGVYRNDKMNTYLDTLISSGIENVAELSNKTGFTIEVCLKHIRKSKIKVKNISEIPEYILTEQDILDSIEMEYKSEDLKDWELEQFQILAKQNRRLVVI